MSDGGAIQQGGTGGVMSMENRMEDVENRLSGMSDELLRFGAEHATFVIELRLLKEKQARQEDDVKHIKDSATKMEVQFNEIMRRWDTLDARMFELLQQSQSDSKAANKSWMDFTKYVIAATIGVIVAALFKGGF